MLKVSLALAALVLALALPAAYAGARQSDAGPVEQTLLRRMNSTPDGRITRRVDCSRAPRAHHSFVCALTSVRSTKLRVDVTVVDSGLRSTWYPLEG